jgi:hypothetical protein
VVADIALVLALVMPIALIPPLPVPAAVLLLSIPMPPSVPEEGVPTAVMVP